MKRFILFCLILISLLLLAIPFSDLWAAQIYAGGDTWAEYEQCFDELDKSSTSFQYNSNYSIPYDPSEGAENPRVTEPQFFTTESEVQIKSGTSPSTCGNGQPYYARGCVNSPDSTCLVCYWSCWDGISYPSADNIKWYTQSGGSGCADTECSQSTPWTPPIPDADGDGIDDENDPFPDDNSPFTWRQTGYVKDVNGNIIWSEYEALDSDGNKVKWSTGEKPAGISFVLINQPYQDQSDWPFEGSYTGSPSTDQSDDIAITTQDPPEYDQGTESAGTETDNESLHAIQSNTAKIAANQEGQGQQLNQIIQGQEASNKLLGRIADKPIASGGEYTGPSADDIGQATADALNQGASSYTGSDITSAVEGLNTTYNSGISTLEDLSTVDPSETPEAYRQKRDLPTELDQLIDSSEYSEQIHDIIDSADVEVIGDCSFSWMYNGQEITFSLCAFQNTLNNFSYILKALVSLTGIFMILGVGRGD